MSPRLALTALLVLALGCHHKPAPIASPAELEFWRWFSANSDRLLAFEKDQEPIFAELSSHLTAVHKDLAFEFGPAAQPREFVVSAGGIRAAFPTVKSLVAAAPPEPAWKVIAFRQRKDIGMRIKVGPRELGAEDIWFSAVPDGDRLGLTLFVKGLSKENDAALAQLMYLMLDTTLGEYDVETRLGAIERKPAPPDPAAAHLRPLKELAAFVDSQKK